MSFSSPNTFTAPEPTVGSRTRYGSTKLPTSHRGCASTANRNGRLSICTIRSISPAGFR
jgi:hypothetical protein